MIFSVIRKKRRQDLSIPQLIDKYLTKKLTRREDLSLGEWINESETNSNFFFEIIDKHEPPARKIDYTKDHEGKAREIATLLAGYMRNNLTEVEECMLGEWIGASPKNNKLFKELTDPRSVQLALELLGS